MGLKEMLQVVRKRAILIFCVVFVCCLTTGVISYQFMTPKYEASTKLIVNKASDVAGVAEIAWDDLTVNIQLIATYKELIKTEAIMDEVIKEHPGLGLTSEELVKKVNVSSVNETQVMTVDVQDESYERAAVIVNAVSKAFKTKVTEIMKIDNVTILNEAPLTTDQKPVWPNPPLNVALSFVLSLIFIVGVAFLIEHLDDTLKTERDVRKHLELPVVAVIQRTSKKELALLANSRKKVRKEGETAYVATNQ